MKGKNKKGDEQNKVSLVLREFIIIISDFNNHNEYYTLLMAEWQTLLCPDYVEWWLDSNLCLPSIYYILFQYITNICIV